MKRILMIGATGRAGRQVAAQLPALDGSVEIRAMVRDPRTADLPAYVEIVQGDLCVPESVERCLQGVDSVFLVWTAPPANVPEVLRRIVHSVRRIVYLSAPYKTAHPFFQASQPNPGVALHSQIEALIEASGCDRTFIRPGMFAANALLWWASQLRAGDEIRWPFLDAFSAPIDERDIAAVAVRALCQADHENGDYVITGPESLTMRQQIATIAAVTGRTLQVTEMTPEEARREWSAKWPETVVNMLLKAWAAALHQPAYLTSTVEEITGRPAHTFRDWATHNAGAFR